MNVFECADMLREEGYEVFMWRPTEGSLEPEIVANKNGQLYNVYLRDISLVRDEVEAFSRARDCLVKIAV